MQQVIIVVPIYRPISDMVERFSFIQLQNILGHYPICLVMPAKMRNTFNVPSSCLAEYFNDENFLSRATYSEMLLSEEFYQRFSSYEYMLIYQLDAFVFSDQLSYFCSWGYDYIGAPWPRKMWVCKKASVGNGGFSLRKISSCIRVIKERDRIEQITGEGALFARAEDNFFAACGILSGLSFRIPTISEALKFSVEWNVAKIYNKLENNLPFGCHGWHRDSYEYWRPHIVKYFDAMQMKLLDEEIEKSAEESFSYQKSRKQWIKWFLISRIPEKISRQRMKDIWKKSGMKASCALWGAGKSGERCLKLIWAAGAEIDEIYDAKVKEFHGVTCIVPTVKSVAKSRGRLIISTKNYEGEILGQLALWGWTKNKDFFCFDDLWKNIIYWRFKGTSLEEKLESCG